MSQPELARRLGTVDAVVVGLCAMVGAGVFVAFAPAAAAVGGSGAGVAVALTVAVVVAFCNAVASAQLAMSHPSSGGTYLFGRVVLGPWWGFVAGWGFVVGKSASCAAMALTLAVYALPGAATWWHRGLAAFAVVALTTANLRGVTRTAGLARVLLATTLLTLAVAVVASLAGGRRGPSPWGSPTGGDGPLLTGLNLFGVLQAAGLLFFALAGYARIATLAEEVREPRVLGRAIVWALGIAVLVYTAVGLTLLLVLGTGLPDEPAPVAAAVDAAGADWAGPVVRLGAVAACLGALLALLAGVGRTTLAMAREHDLPATLASVDSVRRVPDHAQVAIAAAVVALVCVADLRSAIGFSSFGVLVYYAVANLAAMRQPVEQRRWPRPVNLLGLTGCLVLALTLPPVSVLVGAVVLAAGVLGRWTIRTRRAG